jgi:CRISPR-associated protein (TIGR03984 family)
MACEFKAVRELKTGRAYMHPLSLQADQNDPLSWLQRQARAGDVLLAHQDDGAIWGKAHADGDWVTSNAVLNTSPALRSDYLWSARLFNARREILLWRDGDGNWRAREIADEMGEGEPAFVEWYDEPQLLWGDHGKHEVVNGVTFAVLEEGAQGLRHAPPKAIAERGKLSTRNYIGYDEDGCAFVKASRLVVLEEE